MSEEMIRHRLHDKYPSVVNLTHPKTLEIFCSEFPDLINCEWAIEEKFNGFNFQTTYLPLTTYNYEPNYAGSREIQVTRDTEFYGAWAAIDSYKDQFRKIRDFVDKNNVKLTLYMEIFGGKVSKGICYNIEQGTYKIRFIGVKADDMFYSPEDFYGLMRVIGIPLSMYSFPIAIVSGIKAATSFNPIFHSMDAVTGDGGDLDRSFAEGFVAKPYARHYINNGGKNILFKIKNPRFEEFATEKTVREAKPEVDSLRELFKGFLNENRINSAFSKIGPIVSKLQMAQYLRLIGADAQSDFRLQYAEELCDLPTDDVKSVFNVGSFLADQLMALIDSAA